MSRIHSPDLFAQLLQQLSRCIRHGVILIHQQFPTERNILLCGSTSGFNRSIARVVRGLDHGVWSSDAPIRPIQLKVSESVKTFLRSRQSHPVR